MSRVVAPLDLIIILGYLLGSLAVGAAVTRRASRSSEDYFVAGRSLPWWLAGTSMVATTFAADTPLAITGLVASGGIAGNWIWWAVGIAHVIAAVVFSRLWRRMKVVTDAEVMERRYSGRIAVVLRSVKAGYSAVLLNVLTMGWVALAMRKIAGEILPAWDPTLVTFSLMGLAATYSLLGGMRSVVITDVAQLLLALVGSVALAVLVLQDQGGLGGLVQAVHETYPERGEHLLAFVPHGDLPGLPVGLFAVLMTVAWWRNAEGSGYIVQRLGASKSAQDAERASVWFAVLHNAIRPWPWILVALAALVIWPLEGGPEDREALYATLMVERLPTGLLGIAVAALLAAFMSTIDTHMNWGASYLVRDGWERFGGAPERSVLVGRLSGVVLVALGAGASLTMDSIADMWLFIITLGSGLGSVAIARWLWWRVNAEAELTALVVSSLVAGGVVLLGQESLLGWANPVHLPISKTARILWVAGLSLCAWVPVAVFGPFTNFRVLQSFVDSAQPPGFWAPFQRAPLESPLRLGARVVLGWLAVFGSLFGLGGWLLRGPSWALLLVVGLGATGWLLFRPERQSESAS